MNNRQVRLKLNSNLILFIEGVYTEGSEAVIYPIEHSHPGTSSDFEIENITLLQGNLMDLMDWVNNEFEQMKSTIQAKENIWIVSSLPNIMEILTLLCIEEIEK